MPSMEKTAARVLRKDDEKFKYGAAANQEEYTAQKLDELLQMSGYGTAKEYEEAEKKGFKNNPLDYVKSGGTGLIIALGVLLVLAYGTVPLVEWFMEFKEFSDISNNASAANAIIVTTSIAGAALLGVGMAGAYSAYSNMSGLYKRTANANERGKALAELKNNTDIQEGIAAMYSQSRTLKDMKVEGYNKEERSTYYLLHKGDEVQTDIAANLQTPDHLITVAGQPLSPLSAAAANTKDKISRFAAEVEKDLTETAIAREFPSLKTVKTLLENPKVSTAVAYMSGLGAKLDVDVPGGGIEVKTAAAAPGVISPPAVVGGRAGVVADGIIQDTSDNMGQVFVSAAVGRGAAVLPTAGSVFSLANPNGGNSLYYADTPAGNFQKLSFHVDGDGKMISRWDIITGAQIAAQHPNNPVIESASRAVESLLSTSMQNSRMYSKRSPEEQALIGTHVQAEKALSQITGFGAEISRFRDGVITASGLQVDEFNKVSKDLQKSMDEKGRGEVVENKTPGQKFDGAEDMGNRAQVFAKKAQRDR